jgi:dienelactone hydrolase
MISRRGALGLAATSGIWAADKARAAGTPPTIDEILAPREVGLATISPDGKLIAVLRGRKVDNRFTYRITIHPFENLNATQYYDLEGPVSRVMWVSNDKLVVQPLSFMVVFNGFVLGAPPSLRIITPGKPGMTMLAANMKYNGKPLYFSGIIEVLPDEDSRIVILVREEDGTAGLFKLGVADGALEPIDRGLKNTRSWITQNGRPVLRSDQVEGQPITNLMAKGDNGQWRRVRQIHSNSLIAKDFNIVGSSGEPGVILVAARPVGQDTRGVHKFDLRTLSWAGSVSARPGFDAFDSFTDRWGHYIGAMYVEDNLVYDCADAALGANIEELRQALPGNNIHIADVSRDMNRLIVLVDGPQQPGLLVVFDRQAGGLGAIGAFQPTLTPDRLAPMRNLDVRARDGTSFRAYLSTPIAAGPRPLVVMPHGGPEARDQSQFDPLAQILAAQGWLVLQPNFRGSDGYGQRFAEAGYKQWNGRVMDDIEDAVEHVLGMGLADPKKVAIFGWSFGGYAALCTALRKPDLYKAIVSVAGITDSERFLQAARAGGEDSIPYQYWVGQIGDPKKDMAGIRAASPAKRATEFKAPILLIHGNRDENVNVEQSRIMDLALSRARKPYKYREIPDVDHGYGSWPLALKTEVFGQITAFIKAEFDKVT